MHPGCDHMHAHARRTSSTSRTVSRSSYCCAVRSPSSRGLLLDEPTHGLSGHNKHRLLHTLSLLADDPDVAVVYVTHRQDEIETLGFEHCLRLGASSSRRGGSE